MSERYEVSSAWLTRVLLGDINIAGLDRQALVIGDPEDCAFVVTGSHRELIDFLDRARRQLTSWVAMGRSDDDGTIHNDVDQIGPTHSVRWRRARMDGDWETLTWYTWVERIPPDHPDGTYDDGVTELYAVAEEVEWVRHADPDNPGASEAAADYRYPPSIQFNSKQAALAIAGQHAALMADADDPDEVKGDLGE